MAEEAKVKIKISGDAKEAVGALSAVRAALRGVQSAVRGVVAAFGWIGLAIEGVQKLIELTKSLGEWINRAARESAEMRLAESYDAANESLNGTIERQKKLNDLFRESNDQIARKNQLRELEARQLKEIEAIQRTASRAAEIAGVTDPRRRMQIQQRWRAEDEERTREDQRSAAYNAAKDARSRVEGLEWDLGKYKDELKKVQDAKARFGTARRGGNTVYEEGTDQYKEREAKVAQFNEQIDRLTNVIKSKQDELAFEREKSALLNSHWENLETLRKQKASGWVNYDETRSFDEKERKEQDEATRAEAKKAEEAKRQRINEQRSKAERRLSDTEALQTRFLSESGSSSNRLTAIGLGGGVATSPIVAKIGSDLSRVVELQKKQVEALKNMKTAPAADALKLEP